MTGQILRKLKLPTQLFTEFTLASGPYTAMLWFIYFHLKEFEEKETEVSTILLESKG